MNEKTNATLVISGITFKAAFTEEEIRKVIHAFADGEMLSLTCDREAARAALASK